MKRFLLIVFSFFAWAGAQAQGGKNRLLFADIIYFDAGKTAIRPEFEPRLKAAAGLLERNPDAFVVLHSHTDSIGSYQANEQLAALRAQTVIRHLNKSYQIDSNRVQIRSLGEYSPIDDDGTAEGRAQNRRVTVYVMAPWDGSEFNVLSTIAGRLVDAKTGTPLMGRVLLNYLNGRDTVHTDENGYYQTRIGIETYVEVRAYVRGYFFVSKVVRSRSGETHTVNFNLERALIGGKMLLNDLYFQPGTAALLPSSERALQGILTFLQENEDLKVEIGGHINKPNSPPVDKASESFQLSEERARSVYTYFIERNINSNRLRYKGYGNWEMINPMANTEIEQQLNRRVELKVLDE